MIIYDMLSIHYHNLYHQKKSDFNKKSLVSVSFFYVSFLFVVSKNEARHCLTFADFKQTLFFSH